MTASVDNSSYQLQEANQFSGFRMTDVQQDIYLVRKSNTMMPSKKSRYRPKPHGTYKCDMCFKFFANGNSLRTHIRNHTEDKPHKCGMCNKGFIFKHELKNHMYTHTDAPKPHQCGICGKSFMRLFRKNEHMLAHAGIKQNECDICGEAFTNRAGLRRHKLKHSNVKPHACDICGKAFFFPYELKGHIRVAHTPKVFTPGPPSADRPFLCEICNKAFPHQNKKNEHMRVHTGFKPHKCEICGEGFTKRPYMEKHFLIHTCGETFKCDICDLLFSDASGLKDHWQSHDQGLMCMTCGKVFSRLPNFKRHRATCTGAKSGAREPINIAPKTEPENNVLTGIQPIPIPFNAPNNRTNKGVQQTAIGSGPSDLLFGGAAEQCEGSTVYLKSGEQCETPTKINQLSSGPSTTCETYESTGASLIKSDPCSSGDCDEDDSEDDSVYEVVEVEIDGE